MGQLVFGYIHHCHYVLNPIRANALCTGHLRTIIQHIGISLITHCTNRNITCVFEINRNNTDIRHTLTYLIGRNNVKRLTEIQARKCTESMS